VCVWCVYVCVCVVCVWCVCVVCVCVRDPDGDALCRNVFRYSRHALVPIDLNATFDISIQGSQCRYNATMRRVRVTIVAVEKQ